MNIVILQGHPNTESYCHALAKAYEEGAIASGAEVEFIDIPTLEFDPILHKGDHNAQPEEPDLVKAREAIGKADHLVLFWPSWWASMPALTKGFFDRTFIPGFAFRYDGKQGEKLLKGKTASCFVTMDAPCWFYRFFQGAPGSKMVKNGILGFCGIKTKGFTYIPQVLKMDQAKREQWLEKVRQAGSKQQ